MGRGRASSAARQLGVLFAGGTATGLTDGELLERFRAQRAEAADLGMAAEAAFGAIVDRHGAMVWGVCRRVLGDAHEAEDAFQATFLILVRRAGSVRVDGSLGRWLYGVAHRVAIRARTQARQREIRVARSLVVSAACAEPAREIEQSELRRVLDEELERLPAKYRCAIDLCHVQGMSYDQAARELDWPVATVKSRLTRGRLRLRDRLMRRGVTSSAVGTALVLGEGARGAAPPALIHATIRAAGSSAGGVVPAAVIQLIDGVLKMMVWQKIKLVAAGSIVAVGLTAQAVSQRIETPAVVAARPAQEVGKRDGSASRKAFDHRRWVRHLTNRATIEVVGISSYPSGPDTWWRPDGTPLQPAPCDPIKSNVWGGDGAASKSVVVRVTGIPEGAEFRWSMGDVGSSSTRVVKQGGKPVPDLQLTTFLFGLGASKGTVRFEVAAGPWRPEMTCGKGYIGIGTTTGGYIFDSGIGAKGGTQLTVTLEPKEDKAVRLVAVDLDGKEHLGGRRGGVGVASFRQIKVDFAIPFERVAEFRIETRPYEEVEIPGVALERVKE